MLIDWNTELTTFLYPRILSIMSSVLRRWLSSVHLDVWPDAAGAAVDRNLTSKPQEDRSSQASEELIAVGHDILSSEYAYVLVLGPWGAPIDRRL